MEGSAARARALGSVLMFQTATQPQPQPKARRRSTERMRNPLAQCQAYCCPVARANRVFLYASVSNQVSEQISHRKRPSAMRRFEINSRKPCASDMPTAEATGTPATYTRTGSVMIEPPLPKQPERQPDAEGERQCDEEIQFHDRIQVHTRQVVPLPGVGLFHGILPVPLVRKSSMSWRCSMPCEPPSRQK